MHSQPSIWSNFVSIYRTVAVVDLVAYSSLARILEENTSAAAVAELNHKIQDLIQEALRPLSCTSYSLMAKTGDGALILFEDPACAHEFAVGLHACSARHNMGRSETSARRFFRIGLASGEITVTEPVVGPPEYAGITIANAVRLESAAGPGEVLVDLATFESLPPALQVCYSAEFLVRGKREETFRVRKWRIDSASAECAPAPTISRRRALSLALGATAAAGLGCWGLGSPRLSYWLHPLPSRRWVAFAAWPEPAAEIAAVTREVVSSVAQSLRRMENFDHGFLVVETQEPEESGEAGTTSPEPRPTPIESAQKYSANLAMLASTEVLNKRLHLTLKVIDIETKSTLRHATLSAPLTDLPGLRQRVTARVAALLDLPEHLETLEDDEEIRHLPQPAYQLFAEGMAFGTDFNGPRRLEGIEKLQQLVNTYPRFAVGYGELAAAYLEDFRTSRDPSSLALAEANARRALQINSDSAIGLLNSAVVQTACGKPEAALDLLTKLLSKDPQNPDALRYRAEVYREKGDAAGELRTYRQIIDVRPNDWKAYNNRGRVLKEQGNYQKAAEDFQMATHLAPGVSLPLTNLGYSYLETGRPDLAQEAFVKSIELFPTSDAYVGLGTIAFSSKDYSHALEAYRSALKFTPRSHDLYRDIADCQTMLGQMNASTTSFKKAAELIAEELRINPSSGYDWMLSSLYHAKIGASNEALQDVARADKLGTMDGDSLLTKAQTMAVLGRRDESLRLVLYCLSRGVSASDVELAVDLRGIVKDPAYLKHLQRSQT